MVNITARSNKADIVDAALEFTDWQAERIAVLEQRQRILWALLAVLTVCHIM